MSASCLAKGGHTNAAAVTRGGETAPPIDDPVDGGEPEWPAPVTILLVDDHEVVRYGLVSLIERVPDIVVVGEAGSGIEAMVLLDTLDPDVVVLDVRLPDQNGLDLCREMQSRAKPPRCLILTSFSRDDLMLRAAAAGASGLILKTAPGQDVVAAIRRIGRGEVLFDEVGMQAGLAQSDPRPALSPQQRRIFDLLSQGLTNREIAARMHLSEKTVRNYVSAVLLKLGLRRRSEVAAMAAGTRRAPIEHDL